MKTIDSDFYNKIHFLIEEKKEALCIVKELDEIHLLQGRIQGLKEAIDTFARIIDDFDENNRSN